MSRKPARIDAQSEGGAPARKRRWLPRDLKNFLANIVIMGLLRLALSLPYRTRIRFMGWLIERIIAPLAGYRRRAASQIAMIWPEMSEAECDRIASGCLNNAGRAMIENFSSAEFLERMRQVTPTGPGVAALKQASDEGRPVVLVTGHFGNYEATRAALVAQGFDIGGLYRNMKNPYFNAHYVKTMEAFGGPVFPQGRKGTAGFVRHLKAGGQLVLLFDQHVDGAPVLDFLGRPARTAVSAAELALRYDGLLIPFYSIRQPDGYSFECVVEEPISHSNPETMTQAINDSLAERIRAHPDQWYWVHKRWRSQ